MFENNAYIANEECGEISFSVLARSSVSSSAKSKFDTVNRHYMDLRTYMTSSQDHRLGKHLSEFHGSGREQIKDDDPALAATSEHIRMVIRSLKAGTHTEYNGEKEGFKNAGKAKANQMPLHHSNKVWLEQDIDEAMENMESKLFGKFLVRSYQEYHEIWPALRAQQDPASDEDASDNERASIAPDELADAVDPDAPVAEAEVQALADKLDSSDDEPDIGVRGRQIADYDVLHPLIDGACVDLMFRELGSREVGVHRH